MQRRANNESSGDMVFLDPGSGLEIRAISPSERGTIEEIVRAAMREDRVDDALAALAGIPDSQVFAAFLEGILVAAYALRRDGMANDLAVIAVVPESQRRGIGRILLQDALRRSGRRPLAAQTPEDVLPFFKTCGFKLVGRRPQPSGEIWYRVGWHTPGAKFKGGTTSALEHHGIDRDGTS
jgi:GNAT superfamily N-acetyltransferase